MMTGKERKEAHDLIDARTYEALAEAMGRFPPLRGSLPQEALPAQPGEA